MCSTASLEGALVTSRTCGNGLEYVMTGAVATRRARDAPSTGVPRRRDVADNFLALPVVNPTGLHNGIDYCLGASLSPK